MKQIVTIVILSLIITNSQAQVFLEDAIPAPTSDVLNMQQANAGSEQVQTIKIGSEQRWKIKGNKYLTGGLVFFAGAVKGFNEALQYQYRGFERIFPKANDQWFYPTSSFANKYKDGDPAKGPKFPFSTSALVMLTDQYHLNNFIQRSSLTAALVIKIGESKKPWRHYIFDILYYTVCHQAGFHAIYTPIQIRNGK